MNDRPDHRADRREPDDHRQELMDSLLHSLYETSTDQAQSLVSSGMNRLDQNESADPVAAATPVSGRPRALPWMIGLATAALVLVIVSSSMFDQSRTATAAVNRSLSQALEDVGRHYRVESKIHLTPGNVFHCQSHLYVKGRGRFAWHQHLVSNASLWLGSDNGSAWVVPPIGPVIKGGEQSLTEWVTQQKDFSSPYLHITSLLERMRDRFELEFASPDGATQSPELGECDHVLGTLIGPRTDLSPDQVELWTDVESGVAKQVTLRWNLSAVGIGWESITLTLLDETALPTDFFTAAGHGGKGRPQIRFHSGESQ